MHFLAAISISGLIHVLIQLLVLVLIGWIVLWILEAVGAPAITRKIVLVIGALIGWIVLLNLIYPLGVF